MSNTKHTQGPSSINIRFVVTTNEDSRGLVEGNFVDAIGWEDPTSIFGELRDAHPGFAAHIVKCVNLHSALVKLAASSPELRAAIANATGEEA